MGTVIEFPYHRSAECNDAAIDRKVERLLNAKVDALVDAVEVEDKVVAACRAVLLALQHNTVKPDKFFLMYQEGNACIYLNIGFTSDILVKAIDLVLAHGLQDHS